ncbi:MAG: malate dehydrogenase [Nitrospirae bacterium]|nr:malate dehydrogenase [Nitrospirota bacterium]
MKNKVSIIGCGNVGTTTAGFIAQAGISDVVLFDILEGMPQGKALDLSEACPLWGSASSIKGTNNYQDTKDSDIVVITAGLARKPGMSRDDLLFANAKIIKEVAVRVSRLSPEAVIIAVTNPMDAMAYLAWKTSGFPHKRVIGMGGVLDSSRLRTFTAWNLGVSPSDIEAMVIGSHGDEMLPLMRFTTLKGVPVTELIKRSEIDAIKERTKKAGAEIVGLLKIGSAYYSPAQSAFEMIKAILLDEKRLLPCSCYLNGEYGVRGIYVGVPAIIGKEGVEKVIELKLDDPEIEEFKSSIASVRAMIEKLNI